MPLASSLINSAASVPPGCRTPGFVTDPVLLDGKHGHALAISKRQAAEEEGPKLIDLRDFDFDAVKNEIIFQNKKLFVHLEFSGVLSFWFVDEQVHLQPRPQQLLGGLVHRVGHREDSRDPIRK